MTVINTNVGALMARTYATKANDKMQTSMERLSSGLRINSAADDAAGLAVANKMSSQLSGIKMAIRNSQMVFHWFRQLRLVWVRSRI